MVFQELLKDKNIILGSGSPRRKELLEALGLKFVVQKRPIDEHFPKHFNKEQIPVYLAKQKAAVFKESLKAKDILITADTIVWQKSQVLEKPQDLSEAKKMLLKLSGKKHYVVSSLCLTTSERQVAVSDSVKVFFKVLSAAEIDYYVDRFKPLDKAGAYGIQEWIGMHAINRIEGSFFTVMGLPTHLVYDALKKVLR